ncbi:MULTISPECIES: hypothetical protein [unclassified Mycobacterium]|uniref:hypothetical protein n=1 Tax=unclassified Mycobacterium TaxID=2642494 RepID=UPI000B295FDC|nr:MULTISPECIES: hypothetical protein [unclassified Mycobacterium]
MSTEDATVYVLRGRGHDRFETPGKSGQSSRVHRHLVADTTNGSSPRSAFLQKLLDGFGRKGEVLPTLL